MEMSYSISSDSVILFEPIFLCFLFLWDGIFRAALASSLVLIGRHGERRPI